MEKLSDTLLLMSLQNLQEKSTRVLTMKIFFTFSFFILSTLGAGVALEVLMVASLPAEAEVFLGGAPAAYPATFNDGSTTREGTFCLVVASSPTALSSAPCFEHLGSEASALVKKKKREECSKNSSRRIQERYSQWYGNTYIDGSSSSTEMTASLRFQVTTLGPLGWMGRTSPPVKFVLFYGVLMPDFSRRSI
jgi:hypothetical protein